MYLERGGGVRRRVGGVRFFSTVLCCGDQVDMLRLCVSGGWL